MQWDRYAFQSWTDTPGANEALAINCITWCEAMAFCVWDGGFLPTEAEWNYAAAGGSDQRAYPWSSPASSLTIDCSYANYAINASPGTQCVGAINRVGSESPMGDDKYGQEADLAGNVAEWTVDWFQTPYRTPCIDCADLTPAAYQTVRGASFDNLGIYQRGASRFQDTPDTRGLFTGVRCARTP